MFYLSFRDLSIVLKRYVLLASSLSKGIWQMTLKLQNDYRVRILFYVTIDVYFTNNLIIIQVRNTYLYARNTSWYKALIDSGISHSYL